MADVGYDPPHVLAEIRDDRTPEERATFLAGLFRWAGTEFLRPTGRTTRLHVGNERYVELPAGLESKCGQWLIQARTEGLIPESESKLIDLIDFHRTQTPAPGYRRAVRDHCPENLFGDVCGAGIVFGTFKGTDARGRVILADECEGGGLLPQFHPEHLDLPEAARRAATCEWIAGLIERPQVKPNAAAKPARNAKPGRPAGRFKKEIVPHIRKLLADGLKWQTVINRVNKKFDTRYTMGNLQSQYSRANGTDR